VPRSLPLEVWPRCEKPVSENAVYQDLEQLAAYWGLAGTAGGWQFGSNYARRIMALRAYRIEPYAKAHKTVTQTGWRGLY
jgi:hypothetical protein